MTELDAVDLVLVSTLRGNRTSLEPELPAARLMERAEYHGIIPLLSHKHKQQEVLSNWPPAVAERIQAHARQASAYEMLLEEDLQNCLTRLASAGVQVLLTKGALLAYRHYPSPSLRPRCDTDLFTSLRTKDAAVASLLASGYRHFGSGGGDLVSQQAIYSRCIDHGLEHSIDVHWRLFNRHTLAQILHFDLAYRERMAVPELGPQAWGLSPVHALLHACLHRLAHHQDSDRLIWLYDIQLLCDSFDKVDRARFARLCHDYGIAGACQRSLAACHNALPTVEVATLMASLNPGPDDISVNKIIGARHIDVLKQDLGALPLRQKTRLLWQHAFPSSKYMRTRYDVRHGAALPWYYLKRLYNGVLKLNRPRSIQRN